MKVVFLDGASLPSPLSRPAFASQWDVRAATSPEQVVGALHGATVAITNKVKLKREQLEQLPELKLICVAATGYDCIELAACRDLGVTVCNVPAYSAVSVAESVIASLFTLRRHLTAYQQAALSDWSSSDHFCVHGEPIQDIQGMTLAIVGRGDIGSRVARLAKALEMKVIFAEHRAASMTREGYVTFEHALEQADAISLHCPLTAKTQHLIGETELARMRPGTLLINTARGPLVDETALLASLRNGHLGGAALDVMDVEPPRADHPLLHSNLPNLLITPHVAWASQSSVVRLKEVLISNVEAFVKGSPINVVS